MRATRLSHFAVVAGSFFSRLASVPAVRYARGSVLNLLQTFRRIAWFEGVSFLVLLGIAMPLKYWGGVPAAVRVVGSLHGLLFIAYAVSAALLLARGRWSLGRAAIAMLASVVPFGTFVFDAWLQRESQA